MKLLLLFSSIIFIQYFTYSQTSLDNFSYQIYYQTTSTDSLVFDSLCTRICKLTVSDTSDLSYIHIKVGTTEGANDILQHDFVFDSETGLPQGLSYNREQNIIYLGLYETYQMDMYYYEIQIEDTIGNLSTPKRWN